LHSAEFKLTFNDTVGDTTTKTPKIFQKVIVKVGLSVRTGDIDPPRMPEKSGEGKLVVGELYSLIK